MERRESNQPEEEGFLITQRGLETEEVRGLLALHQELNSLRVATDACNGLHGPRPDAPCGDCESGPQLDGVDEQIRGSICLVS